MRREGVPFRCRWLSRFPGMVTPRDNGLRPRAPALDFAMVGAGDPPAATQEFHAFFRAYCPYVARVAITILGDIDEVDDVIQDVFLIAHRRLRDLRDGGAVKGWLATITVREARRRLRRRKRRGVLGLDRDAAEVEQPDRHDKSLEQRVMARTLENALDALPVAERIPWLLRAEGYSLEQVSVHCECSLATTKRRIACAQRKLQSIFGEDDPTRGSS